MSQTTFSIRMDDNLKKDFDKLCEEFGMSMTTAINVFARAVVREKRIPFEAARGLGRRERGSSGCFRQKGPPPMPPTGVFSTMQIQLQIVCRWLCASFLPRLKEQGPPI